MQAPLPDAVDNFFEKEYTVSVVKYVFHSLYKQNPTAETGGIALVKSTKRTG